MLPSPESNWSEEIALARDGDVEAQGRLLERYQSYLTILARLQINRRLQRKVDAEDIVQEACMGAYRDFHQFRGTTEKELAGWLRQVLAHALANVIRHYQGTQQRNVRLERELVSELDNSSITLHRAFVARGASPSQNVAQKEKGAMLAEAIQRLPSDEAQLLMLRHFEGLTFPLIAEQVGRSVDVLKKMWPKALARLRQTLRDLSNESEY